MLPRNQSYHTSKTWNKDLSRWYLACNYLDSCGINAASRFFFYKIKIKTKENKKEAIWNFSFFCEDGWDTKPFAIAHGIGCFNKMTFIIHLLLSFSSFISSAYHELSPRQSPTSKRFLLVLLFFFTVCYTLTKCLSHTQTTFFVTMFWKMWGFIFLTKQYIF